MASSTDLLSSKSSSQQRRKCWRSTTINTFNPSQLLRPSQPICLLRPKEKVIYFFNTNHKKRLNWKSSACYFLSCFRCMELQGWTGSLQWTVVAGFCDPASLSCYGPIYNISHPSFSPNPLPKSPATVRKHLSLSAGPQSVLDCQLRSSSHHHQLRCLASLDRTVHGIITHTHTHVYRHTFSFSFIFVFF